MEETIWWINFHPLIYLLSECSRWCSPLWHQFREKSLTNIYAISVVKFWYVNLMDTERNNLIKPIHRVKFLNVRKESLFFSWVISLPKSVYVENISNIFWEFIIKQEKPLNMKFTDKGLKMTFYGTTEISSRPINVAWSNLNMFYTSFKLTLNRSDIGWLWHIAFIEFKIWVRILLVSIILLQ